MRGFDAADPSGAAENNFSTALLVSALVVVLLAGAAVFAFHGNFFKTGTPPLAKPTVAITNSTPPPKPAPGAPPASDTNWLMTLEDAMIPNSTGVGRIHGQDFIIERAIFQNGTLTLRDGAHGPIESGVQINFSGAQPEALSGQSLDIIADTNKSARVTLHWRAPDGTPQKASYDDSYAMRLEFGALTNSRLTGKIYLCTPDPEKSYVMGKFNADAHKPKPKIPNK